MERISLAGRRQISCSAGCPVRLPVAVPGDGPAETAATRAVRRTITGQGTMAYGVIFRFVVARHSCALGV